MKQASSLTTTFLLSIAQFIIGTMLIAGKAGIHTIGWYYVIASSFSVLVVLVVTAVGAIAKDAKS